MWTSVSPCREAQLAPGEVYGAAVVIGAHPVHLGVVAQFGIESNV